MAGPPRSKQPFPLVDAGTGEGVPWPRDELVVDVFHTAVFALATGIASDALVAPLRSSSARR